MPSKNRKSGFVSENDNDHRRQCSSDSKKSSKSSSSSNSSSSDVHIKVSSRHHSKTRKNKEIDCYRDKKKDKKKCHSDSESNSECRKKDKYSFDEVYKYYKNKLLMDAHMMITGSQAYINAFNNKETLISTGYPIEFSDLSINSNIDYVHVGAPFCVRESGVYILFFIATVDQSSQFAVFVNGVSKELTVTGNNSGAGQLVLRNMLKLEKDDVVIIRDYLSSSPLQSSLYVGGLQPGNNETFLMMKISSYHHCYNTECEKFDIKCLSSRKQYLFKKIMEKMLCDKELMLNGFNVHGTFWSTNGQEILTENNVLFDNTANVNGLSWNNANGDKVIVSEDGVYKIFFMGTTNTSVQFCIAVNDVPIDYTIQGTNKGAGQLTVRSLLPLKKGDVITIKNHTSANGKVIISSEAGGKQKSLSVLLTVFKIAPLTKPSVDCHIKPVEQHDKYYEKFRQYLLSDHCKNLQLFGSPAYFTVSSANHQKLSLGEALHWNFLGTKHNIAFRQSTDHLIVEKEGIYDLFADVITAESVQLTMFINDEPQLTTTSGRDSGSARCLLRQFVKLSKGDVISIRNYESHSGTVNTSLNTGGPAISMSSLFMGFMLSSE